MLILGKLFIQVVNLLIFRSLPLPRCIWSRQVCCQNGKIAWNYWWRTLCSLSDDVRLCQRRNQEISQEIITFSVSHLLEHLKLLEDYSFYRNWGTVPRLLRSQMDVNWQIMSFFYGILFTKDSMTVFQLNVYIQAVFFCGLFKLLRVAMKYMQFDFTCICWYWIKRNSTVCAFVSALAVELFRGS